MKASEVFVKCLEQAGIKYVFGVPGEENLALLDAIRKSSLKFIVTHQEQGAAFMAATVGRLTGKAGVALSTLGPGATNLLTGVAFAQLGGMPLLAITGQKPIKKSKQGKFQVIDTVSMMAPITKMSATVLSGDRIPSLVAEAIRLAETERPGAVHLELPEDIAEEETSALPFFVEKARRPGPDPKAVSQAVEVITKAKHPLVLIAAGANRKMVRKQLRSFLDKTQIPFVTTQMGKGVEDESSNLYLGTTALSSDDYVHSALSKADVVVVVGHDITEKPPVILAPPVHQVIHINFYTAELDDVYIPSVELVGDISHSLWAITEAIAPQKNWNFEEFFKLKQLLTEDQKNKINSEDFPLKPQRIVHDLRTALPREGMLCLDNGMYKLWIARNFPAFGQNTVLLDNALATMGAGLPSGIAAKLLNPEKPVVVVTGDGGFMMTMSELETAKRLNLDLTILILNDSGFGMIRWKQEEMKLPNFGLAFTNPDFLGIAKSFGAEGFKVERVKELPSILEKCINSSGIKIIDCPVDYSENNLVFGKELKSKICDL